MVKIENKMQLLHVVAEAIVIGGVFQYLKQKINTLDAKYQILSKKFEDQSILLRQHEQMIQQLVNLVENLNKTAQQQASTVKPGQKTMAQLPPPSVSKLSKKRAQPQDVNQRQSDDNNDDDDELTLVVDPNLTKGDLASGDDSSSNSGTESDLDAELEEELKELNKDTSLKKA